MYKLKNEQTELNPLRQKRNVEITVPSCIVPSNGLDIDGVRCYVDKDGLAWFNAEDVAKGLGIVSSEHKVVPAHDGEEVSVKKRYISVRWSVLNSYLKEFGLEQDVKRGDYVPEDMAYRLGLRVNNPQAKAFQELLASRILPSIRKQGAGNSREAETSDGMAAMFSRTSKTLLEMSRLFGEMAKVQKRNTELSNELLSSVQRLLEQGNQTEIVPFRGQSLIKDTNGTSNSIASRLRGIEERIEKMERRPFLVAPSVKIRTDPSNYDEKAISLSQAATEMGFYSRTGKPHCQFIGAILQKIGIDIKKGITRENETCVELRSGEDYLTGQFYDMVFIRPAGMERIKEFWEKERNVIAKREYYSNESRKDTDASRKGTLKKVTYAVGKRNFYIFDASGAAIV